ncbi:MAG: hypothetical protein WCH01_20325 [Methylococcaceae bacterium]
MVTARKKAKKTKAKFEAKLAEFEDKGWHCCSYCDRSLRAVIARSGHCLTIVKTAVIEGCHELD